MRVTLLSLFYSLKDPFIAVRRIFLLWYINIHDNHKIFNMLEAGT